MARIRTVKPAFFTSLTIGALTDPWARLCFIGLWTHVDDEGRCIEDRRLIRAALFPLDDLTLDAVGSMLSALAEQELVTRYEHDGRRYLVVNGWTEHQKIDRPQESALPAPTDPGAVILPAHHPFDERSSNAPRRTDERSSPERKGKERKGTTRAAEPSTTPSAAPTAATAPDKRARDALWDALGEHFGQPTTATEKSNRGRQVRELLEAGATPEEVTARVERHRTSNRAWTLTANALVSHWTELGTPASSGTARPNSGDDLVLVGDVWMSRSAAARL